MELDPATKANFHRIYDHHEQHSSEERADLIEEQLYEDAESCASRPTAMHKGLAFKRVRNGYRFFYSRSDGLDVIYAIFHEREKWQQLIEGRYGAFID